MHGEWCKVSFIHPLYFNIDNGNCASICRYDACTSTGPEEIGQAVWCCRTNTAVRVLQTPRWGYLICKLKWIRYALAAFVG